MAKNNQNVPAKPDKKFSPLENFNNTLRAENTKKYLNDILGAKAPQYINNVTALVANSQNLQDCTPLSIIYAAIKATALDLPLDQSLGFAWVIPYNRKVGDKQWVKEAQFQIGYKGFIQLAIRSNQFSRINVTDVRDGELTGTDRMTGDMTFLWQDNNTRLGKKVIGYLAYIRLTNGFEKNLYMTVEELNQHAKTFSKTYSQDSSKWKTDFDAMSKKTVMKLLLSRYAPLSVQQIQEAVKYDQSVISEEGNPQYVDNAVNVDYVDIPASDEYDDLVNEKKEQMRQSENKAPLLP